MSPFRTAPDPADGAIFATEPVEFADDRAAAINKYLQNLDATAREQIHLLTEMLDSVIDENNVLKEENLRLRNELDREKKLHSR